MTVSTKKKICPRTLKQSLLAKKNFVQSEKNSLSAKKKCPVGIQTVSLAKKKIVQWFSNSLLAKKKMPARDCLRITKKYFSAKSKKSTFLQIYCSDSLENCTSRQARWAGYEVQFSRESEQYAWRKVVFSISGIVFFLNIFSFSNSLDQKKFLASRKKTVSFGKFFFPVGKKQSLGKFFF